MWPYKTVTYINLAAKFRNCWRFVKPKPQVNRVGRLRAGLPGGEGSDWAGRSLSLTPCPWSSWELLLGRAGVQKCPINDKSPPNAAQPRLVLTLTMSNRRLPPAATSHSSFWSSPSCVLILKSSSVSSAAFKNTFAEESTLFWIQDVVRVSLWDYIISTNPGVPLEPWRPLATIGDPWRPLATCLKMPENRFVGSFYHNTCRVKRVNRFFENNLFWDTVWTIQCMVHTSLILQLT